MKVHYGDPLCITFGSNIIVDAIQLFQKYGTFSFGYQFWLLGFLIIIFTKIMLCNIFSKIIINFIIYIERSMGIFIVYIGIVGPLSCFDCINFKDSLVIKIIDYNRI